MIQNPQGGELTWMNMIDMDGKTVIADLIRNAEGQGRGNPVPFMPAGLRVALVAHPARHANIDGNLQ